MNNFASSWKWQQTIIDNGEVARVLRLNAVYFFDLSQADFKRDTEQATDYVITFKRSDLSIGLRLRQSNIRYRDFTIRTYNNGFLTEIHKLKNGYGDFYLYGWVNADYCITEWAFINLHQVRQSGILERPRREIANRDNKTRFTSISFAELKAVNALQSYSFVNGVPTF